MLERNVASLTQLYHQLIKQCGELKVDLQLKTKQLARKSKATEDQEKQINSLKECMKNLKIQCDELKEVIKSKVPGAEEILSAPGFAQVNPTFAIQQNVVKTIKGGCTFYS